MVGLSESEISVRAVGKDLPTNYKSTTFVDSCQVMSGTVLRQFQKSVRVNPDTGCWLWVGRLDKAGYAVHRLTPSSPETHAYKSAYEHFVGPVPAGLQLDHTCHTQALLVGDCAAGVCLHRRCVNPEHLEPVTPSENTLRSDHAERRVTHCPQGHEYTEANTIRRSGRRYCRECHRTRWQPTSR